MFEKERFNVYPPWQKSYQKTYENFLNSGTLPGYNEKEQEKSKKEGQQFLPNNGKTVIDNYGGNGIMSVSEFHHKHPCAEGGKSEVCGIISDEVRNNISEMATPRVMSYELGVINAECKMQN